MSPIIIKRVRRPAEFKKKRVQVQVWHDDADWIERLALILGTDGEASEFLRDEIASILQADEAYAAETFPAIPPDRLH